MALLVLLACTGPSADAVLVYARGPDGYTIAAREVPALHDLAAVSGELGTVRHGGLLSAETPPRYTGGGALTVRYAVEDGVAVPLDQDGLLLWSFYAHLADARAAIEARGTDLDAVFPVDLAWKAAASPVIELSPADNAGYAIGSNVFLLLPDGDDRPVPLVANAGVVLHELGHAVFHLRTAGAPFDQPLAGDASTTAGQWQATLHEGFADALAALLLDDPRFLDPSIDLPARHLDGDAVATFALIPSGGDLGSALTYDPYALGSVFAAASWDVRLALDDSERALALLLRAAAQWEPTAEDLDGEGWLSAWVAAADEEEREAACAAIDARFGSLLAAEGCP